jgi:release factor glutamine methyltransferase
MDLKKREKQWLLDEKYQGIENSSFFEDLQKLESGTPLSYLIGNIPFLGIQIDLEYKPLIPRPETEFWVNYCIEKYIPLEENISILDIYSGSGCIGLGIVKKRPNTKILCSDIKKENILQIHKNITINKIPEKQVSVIRSDMFENIPKQEFDMIFANPPYISEGQKYTVDDSVLLYEDHLALFAENDGLFHIKNLIEKIPFFLKDNGYMFIEFDSWQKNLIESYIQKKEICFEFLEDQYQKNRVLIIQNKKPA